MTTRRLLIVVVFATQLSAASHAKHLSQAASLGDTKLNQIIFEDSQMLDGSSGDFA